MMFNIKNDPIGYDELYQMVISYTQNNRGNLPEVIICHPSAYRNFILSSRDTKELEARVFRMSFDSEKRGFVQGTVNVFNVDIIRSSDVIEGFIIIS